MSLRILGVSKTFKNLDGGETEALRNIHFEVQEGEFVCILGPSGCGKTTFLRMIAGLEEPSQGEIHIDGRKITQPTPDIGFVFQESGLFPWLTVKGNIDFGMAIKKIDKATREERIQHYLELIKLRGFENRYPKELSIGMKQRVAIARTLAVGPRILLMDEPFGSVDSQTREFLQEQLVEIWRRSGKTILFVTHNIEEAIFLGQNIIGLSSRPGSVKKMVRVSLAYPRDRTMDEFNAYRKEMQIFIRSETWEGCNF